MGHDRAEDERSEDGVDPDPFCRIRGEQQADDHHRDLIDGEVADRFVTARQHRQQSFPDRQHDEREDRRQREGVPGVLCGTGAGQADNCREQDPRRHVVDRSRTQRGGAERGLVEPPFHEDAREHGKGA